MAHRRISRRDRTPIEDWHRRRFERLLGIAMRRLPRGFGRYLENVAILIAEEPSAEQRAALGLAAGETLFGLYEGTPRTVRGSDLPWLPDRITLFRRPIERACQRDDEIVEEIRRTIIHEVAHHWGFEDNQLPF